MSYHNRGTDRYKDGSLASNDAEAQVQAYFAGIGRPLYKYGLDGIPTENAVATTWPAVIRHTPDFITFGRFVEVKSCFDDYVIIKAEDLESLDYWNRLMPLWFAVFRGRYRQVILADLPSMKWAAAHSETEPVILDQDTRAEKQAYRIPVALLIEEQRVVNAQEASKVHSVPDNYVGF